MDLSLKIKLYERRNRDAYSMLFMAKFCPVISSDKKYITYGLYPQTVVSDVDLLRQLESGKAVRNDNGYYSLNGDYYVKLVAHPYDKRYVFNNSTKIYDGDTYWFKCEPIQWSIIHCYRDMYLLECRHIIDTHCYHNSVKETKLGLFKKALPGEYLYSDIRHWLNSDFIKRAFFADKSHLVPASEVKNCMSTIFSGFADLDSDKVFLLPSYALGECSYQNKYTGYHRSYIGYLSDYVIAKGADLDAFYWSTDNAILSGLKSARVYRPNTSSEYSRLVTDEKVGVVPVIAVKL